MDNHEHNVFEEAIEVVEGFYAIKCDDCGRVIGIFTVDEETKRLYDLGCEVDVKFKFHMEYYEFLKMVN